MPPERKIGNATIFVFFFGSGFAALLYQIVWLKYLNLLLGNTTFASVAVLSAFMFGLSLGSRLAPRLSFLYRFSLRSYGIVELGVGIFATLFPAIYHWLKVPFGFAFNAVGPQTLSYNLLAFLIAFLILVIPTSLMGASLPLLAHYVIHQEDISKNTGYLYAVNTTGAVAGILFSAFFLIPRLGLTATVYVGVLINLIVGLICFLAGKTETLFNSATSTASRAKDPLLFYYAVSGLLAIGYEVLWIRILVLHLGSSVYAYAIMLANFLLGISLGSYVSGRWIARDDSRLDNLFGSIQVLWSFSILIQVFQFTRLSDTLYFFARLFPHFDITSQFLTLFAGTFQILILPTFLSGTLFPLVVMKLWKCGLSIKEAISLSYSYNTIGGILGSIVVGFLLIPVLGTQKSLILLASFNAILGLLCLRKRIRPIASTGFIVPILAMLFLIGAIFVQTRFSILKSAGIFQMEGKEKLLNLEEDVSATVSVEQRTYLRMPFLSISVNGVNVAGTSADLVAIQKMQAHVPMILSGPTRAKKVLHIGFGSGGTAYSVSLYPNTKITVVELSRAIVRNANRFFPSVNHGIVNSGLLDFIFFDGRSYLQNTREHYDVILSDSIHPRYSGNGSLYTKDYYELVYQKLNDGGVHSQWLPLYSLTLKNFEEILRAFSEVFPNTYVWYINSTLNPYVIVTGQKSSPNIELSSLKEAFSIARVKADLEEIGIQDEYALMDYFLFGKNEIAELVKDVDPHLDDRMTVEYESSRVMQRQLSWLNNFKNVIALRTPIAEYAEVPNWVDLNRLDRFYSSTTYNLQGQVSFLEGNSKEAKRLFAEARTKNPDDRDPFEFNILLSQDASK